MKKSWEERASDIMEDPEKFRKAFNITWIVAYGMLILGFVIILWIFLQGL